MRISTAGSCFAQHIGRTLRDRGYNILDVEKGPKSLSNALRNKYSYGVYSARYGNICTSRQFLQLVDSALNNKIINTPAWELINKKDWVILMVVFYTNIRRCSRALFISLVLVQMFIIFH
jgi:hypothetical protein